VIDIAGVDVRAVIQQDLRNLNRRRNMQRRLPIAAARVHLLWIGRQNLLHLLHVSQPHGVADVNRRAALNQKIDQFARTARPQRVIQRRKSARPPVTFLIDVCTCAQESVDDFAISAMNGADERRFAKGNAWRGIVDARFKLRIRFQRLRDALRSAGFDGLGQNADRVGWIEFANNWNASLNDRRRRSRGASPVIKHGRGAHATEVMLPAPIATAYTKLSVNAIMLNGVAQQIAAGREVEFVLDVLAMDFNGLGADEKFLADFVGT
jgi:hypothetical protein